MATKKKPAAVQGGGPVINDATFPYTMKGIRLTALVCKLSLKDGILPPELQHSISVTTSVKNDLAFAKVMLKLHVLGLYEGQKPTEDLADMPIAIVATYEVDYDVSATPGLI